MVLEEFGLNSQSGAILLLTLLFLYWLIRYANSLSKEVQKNRSQLEEDMRELEDVAKKLEDDIERLYGRLDLKADQTQLDLKLEELERKRAQMIQSVMQLKKKAQASVELIAIFTLLLLPILAGFIYAYSAVSDSSKLKADVALDRLTASAERLYVEGPGASALVFVDLPGGIDFASSYIGTNTGGEGRYLSLNVSNSETFRILDAAVFGNWQNTTGGKVKPGFNAFNVTVNSSGCVIIRPR
ncbi:MAG: hypothetical protein V1909_04015 [Candidatus Micrarchaeota archaeon]